MRDERRKLRLKLVIARGDMPDKSLASGMRSCLYPMEQAIGRETQGTRVSLHRRGILEPDEAFTLLEKSSYNPRGEMGECRAAAQCT